MNQGLFVIAIKCDRYMRQISLPFNLSTYAKTWNLCTTLRILIQSKLLYYIQQNVVFSQIIFYSVQLLRGHSVFSSPPQWPMTSDFERFLYQILSITLFSYLNLWERASTFSMVSAKQGNYWYHFYNVFGMTRSLTWDWTRDRPHLKPALYH